MSVNIQHIVAFGAIGVVIAVLLCVVLRESWREIAQHGKHFAAVFAVFAVIATINAQKPPQVREINLYETSHDAKGFDVHWDYGDTDPSALQGKTVMLRAEIEGMDYVLNIGSVSTSVTNYHVNAITHGFPKDWMKNNWKVDALIERFSSSIEHNGGSDE